ncbi:glycosyltransferase family 2 protein [Echinicola salinicaeni]|uniref:glycosyltransferase family 2 protein n=1 Tax=Echinicola salinicaeni TaxID=2762757 RepID=UPI0016460D89|nr:glycosyltransferase family 2 protein [Echinicola salinicaeni]
MELKVSVVIPVYNAEKYLEEAVKSAVFLDEVIEILIVDDLSEDNSLKVGKLLEQEFEKVRVIPNSKKLFAAGCRNIAIKSSKGDLVAFLDADDWYYENRFKRDLEIFRNDSRARITYNFSTINFPNGGIIPYGEKKDLMTFLPQEADNSEAYEFAINKDLVLGHVNANTVHKEVFNNGDFWDDRLKVHADTEFWWRLNRKYKFHASELEQPVSAARRHDHNTIYKKSIKTKTIMLLVWVDNIGLENLYEFEKKALIYHLARAITNPIKNNFIRKLILHGGQLFVGLIKPFFIPVFYKWGMNRYKLYRD